jgi:hypothetical protein
MKLKLTVAELQALSSEMLLAIDSAFDNLEVTVTAGGGDYFSTDRMIKAREVVKESADEQRAEMLPIVRDIRKSLDL